MRPMMFIALLGTALSVNSAEAQDSSEPKAQAPKKRHSDSRASDGLFENGPERPNALVESRRAAAHRTTGTGAVDAAAPAKGPIPSPQVPTVQSVPPGPPQRNLTGEEFGLIRVGSTEKEVLAALGPASSKVVVPDDDGHLRESLQYFVKGKPMGTVRLDNGRVVQIEAKPK